jgi:hypothetical protein
MKKMIKFKCFNFDIKIFVLELYVVSIFRDVEDLKRATKLYFKQILEQVCKSNLFMFTFLFSLIF